MLCPEKFKQLKKSQEIYQIGTKTAENPEIVLPKLPIIQELCLKLITNIKPLVNGGKIPKNLPKWEPKLPKIKNSKKPIKMETKITLNLSKLEPKQPRIQKL